MNSKPKSLPRPRSSLRCSLLFAVLALAAAAPAQAQPATTGTGTVGLVTPSGGFATFGQVGALAISDEADLGLFFTSRNGEKTATEIRVVPSADYFIAPNVSVGGVLAFDYIHADPETRSSFLLAPRIGLAVPLQPQLTLYGRAGIGLAHRNLDTGEGRAQSGLAVPFLLDVRVLFHLFDHVFVGAGPVFSADLLLTGDNNPRVITFGLDALLGIVF